MDPDRQIEAWEAAYIAKCYRVPPPDLATEALQAAYTEIYRTQGEFITRYGPTPKLGKVLALMERAALPYVLVKPEIEAQTPMPHQSLWRRLLGF